MFNKTQQKTKQEKMKNKKIKLKMYVRPFLHKWQPRPSFQQRIFCSLTDITWASGRFRHPIHQIFTKCYRGLKVAFTGRFRTINITKYWWRHQIRPKKHTKTSNNKKGGVMGVWAASVVKNFAFENLNI